MPDTKTRQPASRRRRSSTGSGNALLEEVSSSVDELIRQNKALKQQLARLEGMSAGGGAQLPSRELVALQRRLSRTLDGRPAGSAARGRQSSTRQRRRISDPTVLESRRAALAKAREALAAKRAAQRDSKS